MKCLQLLFVCWWSSIFAVTGCIRVDGYSCVSAYWDKITCVLNITSTPEGQSNSTYSLKFTDIKKGMNSTCPLVMMNNRYSCVCKVGSRKIFTSTKSYAIQLCNESGCSSLIANFSPSQNIQLTPPHQLEVQQTPDNFNITWKSGYEDNPYLATYLEYELSLQNSKSSGSKTLKRYEKFIWLPRLQFDSYATYCIKVRSKPFVKLYNGTWSKWSPQTCWTKDEQKVFLEQENISVMLTKYLGPVCVVVGVLLFVFYSPATRMKIKTLSHTPSPVPFFQSLFEKHEGNLQEWLSPQGKFALTYKTEEILISDAVTVVPVPITKDLEEKQEFHNPSVAQLAFNQCQTSYFSLPGMHGASQPMTMVCPGETSYTQLPHSVWGFGIGEVRAVSASPEDFLEISHADSGCSCEDLTQSTGCSLPSSPVVDSSPPCYSSDYCILNKTAEGVVPVLVSK
ncbi:interleukin-21 receptor-like [Xiphias gladius]|uniref:interleukin-21 receptor-like n=1 Tax=Xiphias gladius TaxID=8245 RepID=UPI001A98E4A5|nr:interleukin-21 receptor-like [Xiphias gladius]